MKKILAKIAFALGKSPIGLIPVRVRKGLAKGSRWTLLPSSAYWRGTFESDIDAAISRLNLKPGMCCWDLGTHFGIYTVGLAKIVGEKGEVIGFEPDPFSYSRCVRHIKMNNLSWAKIFEGAASDVSDYSEILVYGKLGVTTTHLAYPGETGVGAERVKVATFAIDDLVEKSSIRLPNFVKVDVEGHGAKALFGMKKSLLKARPHVIFRDIGKNEIALIKTEKR